VYTTPVLSQGYVSLDKVIYSTILSPEVGNFNFNWIGLVDEDETLIAVSYVPTQYKYQTVGLSVGNTLTRNFLLQYNNAQAVTGISIAAEAWQLDFLGRLKDVEEHVRQDMSDLFGTAFFIGTGFSVIADGGQVTVKQGIGYVGGLRAVLAADQVIATGALPKDVYVEVYLDAGASSSTVVVSFQVAPSIAPLSNYTDALGRTHYVKKIAKVLQSYAVTDFRRSLAVTDSVISSLIDLIALKAPLDSPALIGVPTAPTQATGDVSTRLSTTEFVSLAIANKAPLASPGFSGAPTVPTVAVNELSNKIANTEFVISEIKDRFGKITQVFSGSAASVNISSYGKGIYLAVSDWGDAVLLMYNTLSNSCQAINIRDANTLSWYSIFNGSIGIVTKNVSTWAGGSALITKVYKVG